MDIINKIENSDVPDIKYNFILGHVIHVIKIKDNVTNIIAGDKLMYVDSFSSSSKSLFLNTRTFALFLIEEIEELCEDFSITYEEVY